MDFSRDLIVALLNRDADSCLALVDEYDPRS
jgi:hypothetical protein